MQATEWDRRLVVRADGRNLVGHTGVVLLRKVADRVGLTQALTATLPQGSGPGWRDRGMALVQLACAIVLGARNILEAEQLQHHWRRLFPRPVSDSTLRRTLEAIDGPVAARVERVRAAIRRVVWTLLALRPTGFPWISVCGRELTGWHVLDLDATIVTCTSKKEGAAGTFKGSFGHHPLGAWVANTRECVALLLRPGNAAANDVADHKKVLAAALRQLPLPLWSKLLVRIDGAAFSHALLEHLQALTTSRRRVRWVTGRARSRSRTTRIGGSGALTRLLVRLPRRSIVGGAPSSSDLRGSGSRPRHHRCPTTRLRQVLHPAIRLRPSRYQGGFSVNKCERLTKNVMLVI